MMSPDPAFLYASALAQMALPVGDELCHWVIGAAFAAIGAQWRAGVSKDKRNERRLDEALKEERRRRDNGDAA